MGKQNVLYEKSRRERLRTVGHGVIYSTRRYDGLCLDCGINDRDRYQAYCKPCRAKRAKVIRLNKKLEGK